MTWQLGKAESKPGCLDWRSRDKQGRVNRYYLEYQPEVIGFGCLEWCVEKDSEIDFGLWNECCDVCQRQGRGRHWHMCHVFDIPAVDILSIELMKSGVFI